MMASQVCAAMSDLRVGPLARRGEGGRRRFGRRRALILVVKVLARSGPQAADGVALPRMLREGREGGRRARSPFTETGHVGERRCHDRSCDRECDATELGKPTKPKEPTRGLEPLTTCLQESA